MNWEIDIILWLQSLGGKNSFLYYLMNFISFLGEQYLIVIALMIIYWTIDKKKGEIMIFTVLSSNALNNGIKLFVQRARPWNTSASIQNFRNVGGFSFPSGHSQNSAAFYGSLSKNFKNRIFKFLAIILPCLIALSRMYLGAHFFTDVIIGLSIGYILVFIFYKLNENHWNTIQLITIIIAALLFIPYLCIPQLYENSRDYFSAAGYLFGAYLGLLFEKKYVKFEIKYNLLNGIIKVVIGAIILAGLKLGFSSINNALKSNFPIYLFSTLISNIIIIFTVVGLYPKLFPIIDKITINKSHQN